MAAKQRRDPQREQFWRETIAAWGNSGQSVSAFCSGRGLSEASFYGWRRTLRQRDLRPASTLTVPALVPLRVLADAVVEIVLPAGLVVRVPAGVDAAAVAALVAALRTASC